MSVLQGLHAIGLEAMKRQNADIVSLANVVRSGPGLIMFLIGLLLLAAASIIVAVTIWISGRYQKWMGIPFAFGISLYIPQFSSEYAYKRDFFSMSYSIIIYKR
ncbi:hypothetical protein [Neobacillus ginsengisoli]|uniref:Uncharacterized protein n=1 Tax=Neobacillus ginsengisoli TaxID=904295 RepID=A0ABT9Y293_9BACI|nr:hypothetical protein [Neobacillus ginsengisoli]MDQ0201645.1 hypothetical protein [Neobacillus ginsengisoli]